MGHRDERPVPIPQTSPNTGRTFFGSGVAGAPAPVNHLQEGPVTDQGDAGPGYYQTRGTGNKTGRVSPKQQLRASSRDLTLAHHGLIDSGAADPNQGQLFDADKTVGPRRSDQQIIKDTGGNMPTGVDVKAGTKTNPDRVLSLQYGGARGYLPNLDNKQKVNALHATKDARIDAGTYRGGGATAEIMEDREATRNKTGNQAWYGGVDSNGQHDMNIEGMASQAIHQRAARSGVSGASMTRAAALTSPQSAWDVNKQGSPDHRMPNLNHAEGVVKSISGQSGREWTATDDHTQGRQLGKTRTGIVGKSTPGSSIPSSTDEAEAAGASVQTADGGLPKAGAKAAKYHHENGNDTSKNIMVASKLSQKAGNFEASLRLSGGGDKSGSRAVQRMAAQSYTVDRHDAKAAGIDAEPGLNKVGVYDVVAMTGIRTANKNRELGPHEQAREWVGQRGVNQAEGQHQGMIKPGPAMGLHPDAVAATPPVANTAAQSRARRRGLGTAERMGLEF